MSRRRLLAIVIALVCTCVSFAAHASGLSRVKQSGVLRWGGDLQGGEPYAWEDPNVPGKLLGFEVELADALAKDLGVRAEFKQNDWSNLVPSLERGTFDVILNGLEVTSSRVGRVLFTRPYYLFAERLMVRRADAARYTARIEALDGKRVGTLANSFAHELLKPKSQPVLYEGVEEPYIDLERGRTDAVLLDDIIAVRYGQKHVELAVVGDLADGAYAIGVRTDEADLRDALDAALGRLAQSGELRRILERYSLWNDRQLRLTTWTADDQARLLGKPIAPPKLTAAQVRLFLRGAAWTLVLSTLAMALAIPLGLALALLRRYAPRPLAVLCNVYVEIYRGTPLLLQLYLLYYGLAPIIKLDAATAAILGLGMNYAAYEAEVYRGAMQAVPAGQLEAAYSLGMPLPLALRRILLPQAFRIALPSVTNDYIALLKDSSLVSVITVVELTKQMTITAVDVRSWLLPGVLCAALYFAMSWPLSRLARRLEKRLAGGAS